MRYVMAVLLMLGTSRGIAADSATQLNFVQGSKLLVLAWQGGYLAKQLEIACSAFADDKSKNPTKLEMQFFALCIKGSATASVHDQTIEGIESGRITKENGRSKISSETLNAEVQRMAMDQMRKLAEEAHDPLPQ